MATGARNAAAVAAAAAGVVAAAAAADIIDTQHVNGVARRNRCIQLKRQ